MKDEDFVEEILEEDENDESPNESPEEMVEQTPPGMEASPDENMYVDKRDGLENTPSIYDEVEEHEIKKNKFQEELDKVQSQRYEDEKFIMQRLKEEEEPDEDEEDLPSGSLDDDEIEDAIRYYVQEEQPQSFRHMKKIAKKLGVDYRKVYAIAHAMDEERKQERQRIFMRREDPYESLQNDIPQSMTQPNIPGVGPLNPNNNSDVMGAFMTYLLSQTNKADERAYQDRKEYEQRNQQMMLQMMEMMNKGGGNNIFDGEIGQMIISRMVSNMLNPTPSSGVGESALGTALKTMVETGQFGNIVGGMIDLGQAAIQKKNYDLTIPESEMMAQGTAQSQSQAQAPQTRGDPWTPERYVMEIRSRKPDVPEDVARVVSEWVCSAPDMVNAGPKERYKYIVMIIQWTEQIKSAAVALHSFMIKQNKTPIEAVNYIRKTLPPNVVERLKEYNYDAAMGELVRFENCASLKKYIDFFKHPEVAPKVKAFFEELKKPSENTSVFPADEDIPDAIFEDSPVGG